MIRLTLLALTVLALLLPAAVPASAAPPEIVKVEPPSWWAGHSINPVRLLVRGRNLAGAEVTSAGAGFVAGVAKANAAGTYLFVDVAIDSQAAPGPRALEIRTAGGKAKVPLEILAPLSREGRFQGLSPDDAIYLLMPDRFANGDVSNDDPAVSRGLLDRTKGRFYHGGDLRGVIERLPYLKDLGVTAIWLNPWYDNVDHKNERETYDGQAITDYHGYGAVDFYGVDEHFGDLDTLREMVDRAHALGLKVIQDQVANHSGPYHPWVDGLPDPHLVLRHAGEAPREHVADVDAPGPVLDARDAEGDPRGLVHRHPARPEPGRPRGGSLRDPEHVVVGRGERARRDPSGHAALRPPPLLEGVDGGHQEGVPGPEGGR